MIPYLARTVNTIDLAEAEKFVQQVFLATGSQLVRDHFKLPSQLPIACSYSG